MHLLVVAEILIVAMYACNDVFAKVSGSGNIKVFANKSIDAKVSGSGNIYYKGVGHKHKLKVIWQRKNY